MYERLKSKSSYPDNLVEAIDMEGVTISDIENAMKSEYLDNKDNRYRKFIRLYFKDGLTHEQIGKSVPYSLTPSRVSQLVRYALSRIKTVLKAKRIEFESLDDAKDHVTELNLKYTSCVNDEKAYRWFVGKPGGRKELVAMYEYGSKLLIIFDRKAWSINDVQYQHANNGFHFTASQYEAQYSTANRRKYDNTNTGSDYGSIDTIYGAMKKEDSDWFGNE